MIPRWFASVAALALAPACRCGNTATGADTSVAVPSPLPPAPPPTLPPPSQPTHLEVPPAAALVIASMRTDLGRGATAIASYVAGEVRLETPTRMTGPDPDRTVAYLRRFPDVLVGIAQAIDRGCAGEAEDEAAAHVIVTCPAEALDDEYRGVSFELTEQPGRGWKLAALTALR